MKKNVSLDQKTKIRENKSFLEYFKIDDDFSSIDKSSEKHQKAINMI